MTCTHNTDLLQGPVFKGLLLFALPLLGTSLIQLMFSTADMLFAGNFLGDGPAASVGASTTIVYFIVTFLLGLSAGASVVVSTYFGAGDSAQMQKSLQNAVIIAIAGGIILTILSWLFSPLFLRLINVPDTLFDTAVLYIRIYSLSIFFTALYDFGFSALRAVGNSKKPFVYLAAGGALNIILNAVFLLVFHMGADGLAWATVISQMLIVFLVWRCIQKNCPDNPLRITGLHFESYYTRKILWIGIPVALQSMVITLSNILIQSQINLFGDEIIAAFTYYYKIDNIAWLPTIAFGQASMIFVSQNLGAGNIPRAREGVKKCLILAVGTTCLMSAGIMLFSTPLLSLFTRDPVIIQTAAVILFITMPLYWLYTMMEVLSGALKGAGKTFAAMVIILVNLCLLRTIILYIFQAVSPSVMSISLVYPASWILAVICLIVYYLRRPMTSSV